MKTNRYLRVYFTNLFLYQETVEIKFLFEIPVAGKVHPRNSVALGAINQLAESTVQSQSVQALTGGCKTAYRNDDFMSALNLCKYKAFTAVTDEIMDQQ